MHFKNIPWHKIKKLAKEKFNVTYFRPGQEELIQAVLENKSAIGILPTAMGKSLCFQLPALVLPKTTVVVSPLIALMQDQQTKLEEKGIHAVKLNSTLTTLEERTAIASVEQAKEQLVYVTPERLENPQCLASLKKSGVSLLVVDEAHCVSQWGHDFRPAYLNLFEARRQLGNPPVLALTATATHDVIEDIQKHLNLENPLLVQTSLERKNLFFEVFRTLNAQSKIEKIIDLLKNVDGSGIIYAATIKMAQEVYDTLHGLNVNVGLYHAKLTSKQRATIQEQFMNNGFKVLVATKALGMGIDKPDIRFVIHHCFPDSIESYYQEAGRAGRDGKFAHAALLYRLEDKKIQSYFLNKEYPTNQEMYAVFSELNKHTQWLSLKRKQLIEELLLSTQIKENKLKVIIAQLESSQVIKLKSKKKYIQSFKDEASFDDFLNQYQMRHTSDKDKLEKVMRYSEFARCRMGFIAQYFEEQWEGACGHCDNCRDNTAEKLEAGIAI